MREIVRKDPRISFQKGARPSSLQWAVAEAILSQQRPNDIKLSARERVGSPCTLVFNRNDQEQVLPMTHSFVLDKRSGVLLAVAGEGYAYLKRENTIGRDLIESISPEEWSAAESKSIADSQGRENCFWKLPQYNKTWKTCTAEIDGCSEAVLLYHSFIKLGRLGVLALDGWGHSLGEGAFGKVKLAITKENVFYAIKITKRSLLPQDSLIDQMRDEYRIGAKMNHVSYFVGIFYPAIQRPLTHSSAQFFFVMQRYDMDLLNYFHHFRSVDIIRLSPTQQYLIFSHFFEVLHAIMVQLDLLRQHGILHRDIKPENIFLNLKSFETLMPKKVVIGDFGLSVKVQPDAQGNLAFIDQKLVGTNGYFPPIQLQGDISRNGFLYTQYSDLYAFVMTMKDAFKFIYSSLMGGVLFEVFFRALFGIVSSRNSDECFSYTIAQYYLALQATLLRNGLNPDSFDSFRAALSELGGSNNYIFKRHSQFFLYMLLLPPDNSLTNNVTDVRALLSHPQLYSWLTQLNEDQLLAENVFFQDKQKVMRLVMFARSALRNYQALPAWREPLDRLFDTSSATQVSESVVAARIPRSCVGTNHFSVSARASVSASLPKMKNHTEHPDTAGGLITEQVEVRPPSPR